MGDAGSSDVLWEALTTEQSFSRRLMGAPALSHFDRMLQLAYVVKGGAEEHVVGVEAKSEVGSQVFDDLLRGFQDEFVVAHEPWVCATRAEPSYGFTWCRWCSFEILLLMCPASLVLLGNGHAGNVARARHRRSGDPSCHRPLSSRLGAVPRFSGRGSPRSRRDVRA